MKILCISDEIDPLVYSNSIVERFADIDCVLSAGDLPLDYLEFIVSSLNKPLLFVFGNHNLGDFHLYKRSFENDPLELNLARYFTPQSSAGALHIGSKVMKESSALFAGLGGSMAYNNGENQFSNFGMKLEIIKIVPALLWNKLRYGRFLDVLLTHAPPEGIHDKDDPCHKGFSVFLWFMRVFKPRYLIHGHIHLLDRSAVRKTLYKETLVINAFSHYILDFEHESAAGAEIDR